MKILKVVKNVIVTTLVVLFFIFALSMTMLLLNYNQYGVTQFENKSLIIIRDEISSDKYKKGDLVITEAGRVSNLKKGDELFVYRLKRDNTVEIDLGIVDYVENDSVTFVNGETYNSEFIAGKSTKIYNDIGTTLSFVTSKWGFLFLILVPSFLIFVYQVYALIIEIKYGEEDYLYDYV